MTVRELIEKLESLEELDRDIKFLDSAAGYREIEEIYKGYGYYVISCKPTKRRKGSTIDFSN